MILAPVRPRSQNLGGLGGLLYLGVSCLKGCKSQFPDRFPSCLGRRDEHGAPLAWLRRGRAPVQSPWDRGCAHRRQRAQPRERLPGLMQLPVQPYLAPAGNVRVFGVLHGSVLPVSILVRLGLPLQLSFSREKRKKKMERRGKRLPKLAS